MIFDYTSWCGNYKYEFYIAKTPDGDYVMINTYHLGDRGGTTSTGRKIQDRKIIWHSELEDRFLYLTPEAKSYINKIIKLIAFT